MIVIDTFADVSGGEVIHSTTQVYFGRFLRLLEAVLCLAAQASLSLLRATTTRF